MKLTNLSVAIRSETVEDSSITGPSSTIVGWMCEVDGCFRLPEISEAIEFSHRVAGRTPSDAWENMLRDLAASDVEL